MALEQLCIDLLFEEIANLKKEIKDLIEFKQVMIKMNNLEDIEKHKCVCGSPASYWKISCYGNSEYVCMKFPSCKPIQSHIFVIHPPKKPSLDIIDTDISMLYDEVKQ